MSKPVRLLAAEGGDHSAWLLRGDFEITSVTRNAGHDGDLAIRVNSDRFANRAGVVGVTNSVASKIFGAVVDIEGCERDEIIVRIPVEQSSQFVGKFVAAANDAGMDPIVVHQAAKNAPDEYPQRVERMVVAVDKQQGDIKVENPESADVLNRFFDIIEGIAPSVR